MNEFKSPYMTSEGALVGLLTFMVIDLKLMINSISCVNWDFEVYLLFMYYLERNRTILKSPQKEKIKVL